MVSDNSACTVDFSSKTVVPEKSASFTVTNGGFDEDTVVTYTVTYNIIDTNTNQALYTGLTCKTYQFVTPLKNWSDSVYPAVLRTADSPMVLPVRPPMVRLP